MRLGKTRQAIDAAQELFLRGDVDSALVVAPGEIARSVWASPDKGQIAQYSRVPAQLTHVRAAGTTTWSNFEDELEPARYLSWYVTNYELVRREERLRHLLSVVGPKTFLILDEASAVKSPESRQTRACYQLAQVAERAVLLNGTPHGDNPGDLYAPFKILDPRIIGCDNWYQFRAKYAKMGGYRRLVKRKVVDPLTGRAAWRQVREPVQIVGWLNLDDLYDRTRPYVLRRTMDEVFDLPPALDPVVVEVPLGPETWNLYRRMRDQAVLELEGGTRVTAAQAGVRILRLAQITSGYVSGDDSPDPVFLSREKLDAVLAWHEARLGEDPRFRCIFWCRFRAEAERLAAELESRGETRLLYGGQDAEDRDAALRLMGPGCPDRAANLVGIQRTGGMGLDFSGASTTVHVSNEYSLMARQQADSRPLGPNQTRPCAYFDFVATGPDGQKTVDHVVVRALGDKEDLASWGAARWANELREGR